MAVATLSLLFGILQVATLADGIFVGGRRGGTRTGAIAFLAFIFPNLRSPLLTVMSGIICSLVTFPSAPFFWSENANGVYALPRVPNRERPIPMSRLFFHIFDSRPRRHLF
jgi:hypothetical protein